MANGGLLGLFKRVSSTESEIKELLNSDDSVIEPGIKEIIENVLDFKNTEVGDIMTHRSEVVAAEDTVSLTDVAAAAIKYGYSRIPIYHENLDNIIGIAYAKDLLVFVGKTLTGNEKIIDYTRKPMLVPETLPCAKLLAKMQADQIQLAVVVDEYGGTAGIVTLEDIVEEVVGDIEDEYDAPEREYVKLSDNTFIFDGTTDIEDVSEIISREIPEGDYDTLAGFVISLMGYLPDDGSSGQKFEYNNIALTVLKVKEQRIDKIKVEINDRTDDNT